MPAPHYRPMGRSRRIILAMVLAADGRPPSLREMADATGAANLTGVLCHLHALRKAGLVDWVPGLARTIQPTCRWIPADRLTEEASDAV